MRYISCFCFLSFLFTNIENIQAQPKRFDSTLQIGKVGFRVICNNKNAGQNELGIKPVGFEHTARQLNFYINGRVTKAEIDDLNNDGFPDLLVYIFGDTDGLYGNAYAFASVENKSIVPFALPDILLDPKIKEGYRGHDEFSLLEGMLIRQFPRYKPGDEKNKPTGGKRVVNYQMHPNEHGGFKFIMLQYYDLK
ncbi:MAG TPA: hypothetical protein VGZ71_15010 [Puia sp.]|jgi:hypothetical protein|nr:hypothetical protein [Puia sp.]